MEAPPVGSFKPRLEAKKACNPKHSTNTLFAATAVLGAVLTAVISQGGALDGAHVLLRALEPEKAILLGHLLRHVDWPGEPDCVQPQFL